MTFTSRLGSSNLYDSGLRNITSRQADLSGLQENLTSGKKVVRASDDPTGIAQAERALTRMSRIQTDQRALESQKNSIAMAESTLGDVTLALQNFRELVVSAGNGAFSQAERQTVALQLTGLRDQIVALANRNDTNGMPLFAALGSALAPFVGPSTPTDYTFDGLPGQSASNEVSIPYALDGDSAFMLTTARDGAYNVTSTNPALRSGGVSVSNALAVTNASYSIAFTAVDTVSTPGTTNISYDIIDSSGNVTAASASYVNGQSFTVTGISGLSMTLSGTPTVGDTVTLDPSASLFSVLDDAIRDIGGASSTGSASQAVGQALHNIDIGMNRVSAVRGLAGDLLNRADRISANQEVRSIQLEADRSRAEDLDMIKGISDFQNKQTGYQAALQSYAQIQKLSLFNFIG